MALVLLGGLVVCYKMGPGTSVSLLNSKTYLPVATSPFRAYN